MACAPRRYELLELRRPNETIGQVQAARRPPFRRHECCKRLRGCGRRARTLDFNGAFIYVLVASCPSSAFVRFCCKRRQLARPDPCSLAQLGSVALCHWRVSISRRPLLERVADRFCVPGDGGWLELQTVLLQLHEHDSGRLDGNRKVSHRAPTAPRVTPSPLPSVQRYLSSSPRCWYRDGEAPMVV